MRKNLVLLRVGPGSLHPEWLDPTKPRNWDLRLAPYTEIGPQGDDTDVGPVVPGPKWSGLREALNAWDGWREYSSIWLPDDDIRTTQEDVNSMFDAAESVGLDLYAPALDSASYYAHFTMMQNRSFYGRKVGFVEIMVPGFSRSALELLLPTLDLSTTGWGLGLDSVWPKLLDYQNVGILDAITVTHTRPIGERRDEALARRMLEESDAILARYGCEQVHTTFEVFGPDARPIEMAPERLLVQLVDGWDYVIRHDPRVLAWIVENQRGQLPFLPYPVEGTPQAQLITD